ncbi:MAG TPA: thioesterase domain-containing protein [Thermoanaerobaculia bacterium]|nr:thioesterase domain-containing protein [Thermoanaerobaculia bacterium]
MSRLHQGSLDRHAAALAAQEDGGDGAAAPGGADLELSRSNPWLAYREINPRARLRLFCFPYAGGGASAYRGWGADLPSTIEVCPVQLPGREGRLREPPPTRIEPLVAELAGALPLADVPFAFFGHSLGALVAYELARALRRRGGPEPLHLLLSGRRGPRVPGREEPIHELPEAEFLARLRELNGTPEEVLGHGELMALLLPLLRADFALHETWTHRPEEPLAAGISVFGGLGDPEVTREDLEDWRGETRGRFRLRLFPGDHFFLHSARGLVAEAVARDLAELAPPALAARP